MFVYICVACVCVCVCVCVGGWVGGWVFCVHAVDADANVVEEEEDDEDETEGEAIWVSSLFSQATLRDTRYGGSSTRVD